MNYKKDVEKMQTEINKTIKLLYSLNDMGTLRTYGTQARNLTKKLNHTINEFKKKTKNWDDEYKKTAKIETKIIEPVENIKKTSKKQYGGETENKIITIANNEKIIEPVENIKKTSKKHYEEETENKIITNANNNKNVKFTVANIKKQQGGTMENKENNKRLEIKSIIDSLNDY